MNNGDLTTRKGQWQIKIIFIMKLSADLNYGNSSFAYILVSCVLLQNLMIKITITLSLDLQWCETWSHSERRTQSTGVQSKVFREYLVSNNIADKIHNEKDHNLYSSFNSITVIK
jgi:hypothetical protein